MGDTRWSFAALRRPVAAELKQVARALDVRYVTAYRCVRQGRLPARREGNVWLVEAGDLEAFAGPAEPDAAGPAPAPADLLGRFRDRLLATRSERGLAWPMPGQRLHRAVLLPGPVEGGGGGDRR